MNGVVYKSTGSWYTVKATDGVFYECKIKGKFRIEGIKSTNPVAAGDHVVFEVETKGDETIGIINKIAPRENYIIRKSVNLSKQTHIIAANVDVAFLLVTLNNPPTFAPFIDRFLVTAEAYHIKAVLLFNKIDTYNEDQTLEIKYLVALYRSIGYECVGISAKTGKNIDKVKQMMQGKVSMFSGHSGVGKSTLVNTLEPTLELKTKQISTQHMQGQHTTTFDGNKRRLLLGISGPKILIFKILSIINGHLLDKAYPQIVYLQLLNLKPTKAHEVITFSF